MGNGVHKLIVSRYCLPAVSTLSVISQTIPKSPSLVAFIHSCGQFSLGKTRFFYITNQLSDDNYDNCRALPSFTPYSLVYIHISFFGKKTRKPPSGCYLFLDLFWYLGIPLGSPCSLFVFGTILFVVIIIHMKFRKEESRNDTRKWDLGLLIAVREHLLCKFNEAMSALFFGCGEADQGNIKRVLCKGEREWYLYVQFD